MAAFDSATRFCSCTVRSITTKPDRDLLELSLPLGPVILLEDDIDGEVLRDLSPSLFCSLIELVDLSADPLDLPSEELFKLLWLSAAPSSSKKLQSELQLLLKLRREELLRLAIRIEVDLIESFGSLGVRKRRELRDVDGIDVFVSSFTGTGLRSRIEPDRAVAPPTPRNCLAEEGVVRAAWSVCDIPRCFTDLLRSVRNDASSPPDHDGKLPPRVFLILSPGRLMLFSDTLESESFQPPQKERPFFRETVS